MFPTTLVSLLIVLLFIVPGLITRTLIAISIPRREQGTQAWLVEIMLFSAVSFLVFATFYALASICWTFPAPDLSQFPPQHPPLLLAVVLYIVFFMMVPALLGFGVILTFEKGWLSRLFERLRIKAAHPAPRAWDYYFSQQGQTLVLVTLKSGKQLAGYMGSASFASSYPAAEDLFLERQLYVTADGTITGEQVPSSAGVWIQGSEICYIQVYKPRPKVSPESTTATER